MSRIGHEIFWSPFPCRIRVVLAFCSMLGAMLIICGAFFVFQTPQCWWVILANLLGGIGIGALEPTLLSSILPLGDATKVWALYGISVGFNCMAVAGFWLLSVDMPLVCVYAACGALCLASIMVYLRVMQDTPRTVHADLGLGQVRRHLAEYKQWLYALLPYGVLLTLDLFVMNFFCTISVWYSRTRAA